MMTALKHLMILKALLSAEAAGCAGPRTEGELRKTLWESRSFTCPDCHSGYSKDTRPSVAVAAEAYTGAENETLPFAAPAEDIQVAVQFFTLQDVDATLGTISVQATVNLYWVDKRLAFNDSSQGGCFPVGERVGFEGTRADEIWRPDVFVSNSAKTPNLITSAFWLNSNGRIRWARKANLDVRRARNLRARTQSTHIRSHYLTRS